MTPMDLATLRRLLAEIKESATGFDDAAPELINRFCDVNYLAGRAQELIAVKPSQRLMISNRARRA